MPHASNITANLNCDPPMPCGFNYSHCNNCRPLAIKIPLALRHHVLLRIYVAKPMKMPYLITKTKVVQSYQRIKTFLTKFSWLLKQRTYLDAPSSYIPCR